MAELLSIKNIYIHPNIKQTFVEKLEKVITKDMTLIKLTDK